MEKNFRRIKNYNVSVKEVDNRVIFLRKLVRGGSEHSFGIHVAQIAGMPKSIVKRANDVLSQLESQSAAVESQNGRSLTNASGRQGDGTNQGGAKRVGKGARPSSLIPDANRREGMQLSFFQLKDPVLCQVRDEILGLDVNNLTPLEALNKLNEIKKIVTGKN